MECSNGTVWRPSSIFRAEDIFSSHVSSHFPFDRYNMRIELVTILCTCVMSHPTKLVASLHKSYSEKTMNGIVDRHNRFRNRSSQQRTTRNGAYWSNWPT